MAVTTDFTLEDRYLRDEGTVVLSGVQALLRVLVDQHRADQRRNLNTATLVSGYRGSPLGGIDLLLGANPELLESHQITFLPGLNEDLGATAILGSQLAHAMPDPRYDGVLGMWYGKAPGVDRSGDAIKHGNMAGVGPNGGVLLVAGDDPATKSSTLPSGSEFALLDMHVPILYPGTVQEILDYGRLGFELSRYSGVWAGLKVVTNVADEYSTVSVDPHRVTLVDPAFIHDGRPWAPTQDDRLFGQHALDLEREMFEGRFEAVRAWSQVNGINEITVPTADAWLGIVAAGKTYYDVREALDRLGLDERELDRRGVRILKPGMLHPLDGEIVTRFAAGLETLLVIEEKRPFLETFVKDALYGSPHRPTVVGKRTVEGRLLVPGHGEIDADGLFDPLMTVLSARIDVAELRQPTRPRPVLQLNMSANQTEEDAADPARSPHFCSGCPHNRSTMVPEGSEAGGGIGCHGMAGFSPARNVVGTCQMGGEGIVWVGAAPFSGMNHRFQNLGDGTFHHSGSLAVRQAVAAGTNITFKILYNAAVAMTGGQEVDGAMPVPELTRMLEAEGVRRTIVVAEDPEKYPADARFADGVDVMHRDDLMAAQTTLRDTPGVTVLIYDQPCAADLRRQRKRGTAVDPKLRVFINEAVCEGCGDCGAKSTCLSVQPVETEFGRKTQIHQSSCNKDYSCLDGDCPAFITVIPEDRAVTASTVDFEPIGDDLPEPIGRLDVGNIYLMGIGGTGVVTVNQLLATAALIDGKFARSLDQTGLSQKGGPVVSNLKVSAKPMAQSNKVGLGEADAFLVFDILSGSTAANLDRCLPDRTTAIVSSSVVPTSAMVTDTAAEFPQFDALRRRIDARTRTDNNVYLDAEAVAENLFRSHMPANIIVMGAAYQTGAVPISAEAIEKAIELNGVAVEMNRQAFRVGRKIAADPTWLATIEIERPGAVAMPAVTLSATARSIVDTVGASGELRRLLEIRVPELIAYQDVAYAIGYAEFVARVRAAEAPFGADTRLSEAVARHLFKLMAYKDEYEVARLHLASSLSDELSKQFGAEAQIAYKLHPPMLRALGMDSKIEIPANVAGPAFKSLVKMKRMRGSRLDPFGRTEERRIERELPGEYRRWITSALRGLSPASHDLIVELAELPDVVRGYDEIKLRNVETYRNRAAELRVRIDEVAGR